MQTKTRLSRPRNQPAYEIGDWANVANVWDAFNRAEYYLWAAFRAEGFGVNRAANAEAYKAKARYFLSLATRLRSA